MLFSDFRSTWLLFLVIPIVTVIIFSSLGIYRWVVRSSNDLLYRQILKACVISTVCLVVYTFLFPPDRINPRSVFLIYFMFLFAGTVGVRFIWQTMFKQKSLGEPVAIYGAGDAGRKLLASLTPVDRYRPVVFIDDNKALHNSTVGGINVIDSATPELKTKLLRLDVEKVIIAIPSMSAKEYEKQLDRLNQVGIELLTIPTLAELGARDITPEQVRNISILDILGRSEIPPNLRLMGGCVNGKAVLVTGGGGSIGSELCRQIIELQPNKLVVLDHAEPSLYKIIEDLNGQLSKRGVSDIELVPVLSSVCDSSAIKQVFDMHSPDTVFHAAAYKHVPIIEDHPEQGVKVNVFGTLTVMEQSIASGVKNFVLISTDKAVHPKNAMGATKRIAELCLQAKARDSGKTKMCIVRFGNVLGSSGSVFPKFRKQIEAGGPVTLTNESVTRYFMTVTEAAQLVMQASTITRLGDVFVLDMGEPVKIKDLAESMIKLAGKKLRSETGLDTDIDIVVEGLRPGEKLHEELFISSNILQTKIRKVYSANEEWVPWSELSRDLDKLKSLLLISDREKLRSALLSVSSISSTKRSEPISAVPEAVE